MVDNNDFFLVGRVSRIDTRTSRSSGKDYHYVFIESAGEEVPIYWWRTLPVVGRLVRVTGKLGNRNGYLELKSVECEQLEDEEVAPDKIEEVEIDDGLPF